MNEREKLMNELSAVQFAAHELHIYLDTHPDDTAAAKVLAEYENQSAGLREQYESMFGPLTSANGGNRWAWIADPWPWNDMEG